LILGAAVFITDWIGDNRWTARDFSPHQPQRHL